MSCSHAGVLGSWLGSGSEFRLKLAVGLIVIAVSTWVRFEFRGSVYRFPVMPINWQNRTTLLAFNVDPMVPLFPIV